MRDIARLCLRLVGIMCGFMKVSLWKFLCQRERPSNVFVCLKCVCVFKGFDSVCIV